MISITQQLQDALGGPVPKIEGTPAQKADLLSLCRESARHAAEAYWVGFEPDYSLSPEQRFEIIERLIGKVIDTAHDIHAAMGLIDAEFELEVVAAVTSSFRHRLEDLLLSGTGGRA